MAKSLDNLVMLEGHLALIFKCIEDYNCGYTDFAFLPILGTCFSLTRDYDESHNLKHHVSVLTNSLEIFSYEFLHGGKIAEPRDLVRLRKIIIYASLLHDTIDYKYPHNLEKKKEILDIFLKEKLESEWLDVKWVIDNISYSKEVKTGYPHHSDAIVQIARDIVSDADKIEALGEIGIQRCRQYSKETNKLASDEEITRIVVEHCHEKLLRLKDNFIRTCHGKLMAESRHQVIVDFVEHEGESFSSTCS